MATFTHTIECVCIVHIFSYYIIIYSVLLKSMQHLSRIVDAQFVDATMFDGQLCHTIFSQCAAFITQPLLQQASFDNDKSRQHQSSINLLHRYVSHLHIQ